MILFLQCCVVALGVFVVLISLYYRKIPKGLIERLLIVGAIIILAIWTFRR